MEESKKRELKLKNKENNIQNSIGQDTTRKATQFISDKINGAKSFALKKTNKFGLGWG